MKNKEIKGHISVAIGNLVSETRPLPFSAHEQSFSHRLAVHMEELFEEWDVDCEYDRLGTIQKRLERLGIYDYSEETGSLIPDIIVHKRKSLENLLVIEMKKNDSCNEWDKRKLELLTSPGKSQYQLGLYINIEGGKFKDTWYKEGKTIDL